MIFSCIVLFASALFLLAALICVITEPLLNRDKPVGRFFRTIRINLREVGLLPYIFILLGVLLIGRLVRDTDWRLVWIAAAVFLLAVIILHLFLLIHPLRSKRTARLKSALLLSDEARELPELSPAKEAALAKEAAAAEITDISDGQPES